MPALGMAQETGKLISWLKKEGETVSKGEPIMEIETDKVVVEIEAAADGILDSIQAEVNQEIQVGTVIAWILAPGEEAPEVEDVVDTAASTVEKKKTKIGASDNFDISPVALNIAQENEIDLNMIKTNGRRIQKADVLSYLENPIGQSKNNSLALGSPKAKRLAKELGIEMQNIVGSGPGGAVLAADVPLSAETGKTILPSLETPGTVWRLMAERMSASWATVPHFYLVREVDVSELIEWRKRVIPTIEKRTGIKTTFTDLLVKVIGLTLRDHPRVNASWAGGNIQWNPEINLGIAVAVDDGLIVPVIHGADGASLSEIATKRSNLIERARQKKLCPADISGGTFTLTNLGMYNIDAFDAIVNTPEAAILSVGRIADRVVSVDRQITIRPMMVLTLSLDHRVVDGARAAQFLDSLAKLIEDPSGYGYEKDGSCFWNEKE